jgi:crossover junction endodeoxyribonuclease RuvC
MVTPQKWQKHYGKSSDKEHSRQLANRLFPSLADRLNRKKDDGSAEALLIAKYGSEQK